MKITTKGRYALCAMIDIAIHAKGDLVSLNHVADRQNFSVNYLEQLFSVLRKAGLVNSIKGAQGGYVLTDHPAKITVGSVLRAMEGELSIANEGLNELTERNIIREAIQTKVWDGLNANLNCFVDTITLQDMVEQYEYLQLDKKIMFYI